jgi:hypothetical protein
MTSIQDKLFWEKTDLMSLQRDSSSFANTIILRNISEIDCRQKVIHYLNMDKAFALRNNITEKEQEKLYELFCERHQVLSEHLQNGTFDDSHYNEYCNLQKLVEKYEELEKIKKERRYILSNFLT